MAWVLCIIGAITETKVNGEHQNSYTSGISTTPPRNSTYLTTPTAVCNTDTAATTANPVAHTTITGSPLGDIGG